MIEVEYYRRVAERTVGRTHRAGRTRRTTGTSRAAPRRRRCAGRCAGATVTGTRRIGKLLLLDTDGADARPPVRDDRSPARRRRRPHREARVLERPRRARRGSRFALRLRRRRRPRDRSTRAASAAWCSTRRSTTSGIDALEVRQRRPARRCSAPAGRRIKAWLLDQSHVAGVGNLLADEILWRAGIDPRAAGRARSTRTR